MHLENAATQFAAGDFSPSIDERFAAEASLAEVSSRAVINVLIAAAALGAVILALLVLSTGFLVFWAARNEPTPAQA